MSYSHMWVNRGGVSGRQCTATRVYGGGPNGRTGERTEPPLAGSGGSGIGLPAGFRRYSTLAQSRVRSTAFFQSA